MAGGAPSPQSTKLAQQLAEQARPEVDLAALPASSREQFETYAIDADAALEQRDDDEKVTAGAHVVLSLKEAPTVTFPTMDGIAVRGGKARSTVLSPENAIAVGEMLIREGEAARDSRKEQPLTTSLAIAGSMSEADVVAQQAAAAARLKDPGQQ